jgi:nitrite reductase/ring-hydroxylating ferredoxin subunit
MRDNPAAQRWFPVARAEEVARRHVVHAQLLGQEIALWRDDSGLVNAWENRCPHRGVRLSIGLNTGTELRCQYHGWRYASGDGRCTFIPAHPDQKPPNVIRAVPYGCAERHGFVWVRLAGGDRPLYSLDVAAWTTLRSLFTEASVPAVSRALIENYPELEAIDDFILEAASGRPRLFFLLQPVSERQTLIHGFLAAEFSGSERLAILREHNARVSNLRDAIEKSVPERT